MAIVRKMKFFFEIIFRLDSRAVQTTNDGAFRTFYRSSRASRRIGDLLRTAPGPCRLSGARNVQALYSRQRTGAPRSLVVPLFWKYRLWPPNKCRTRVFSEARNDLSLAARARGCRRRHGGLACLRTRAACALCRRRSSTSRVESQRFSVDFERSSYRCAEGPVEKCTKIFLHFHAAGFWHGNSDDSSHVSREHARRARCTSPEPCSKQMPADPRLLPNQDEKCLRRIVGISENQIVVKP